MKVLQTIPYMLASQGGPSTCTCDLLQGLNDNGGNVDLLTVSCNNPKDRNLGKGTSWLKEIDADYKTPLALSRNTDAYLVNSEYDIYHANTLWLYPVHATCRHARNNGKPYIISTHGMLYPTALAVSRWKKRLMETVWFRNDISNATCLHATCMAEMRYNRAYGYKGPIAVIPNPVVFPNYVGVDDNNKIENRKIIGFLGRLHPIKRVEQVLYAINLLHADEREQLCFQIMGKFDDQYEQWLKNETIKLHLEKYVEFVGFVSGKEKYERLSRLSALMVPSAQENFGMIVPEALICSTPVYASLGTPWEELNECNCGWWKDNSPESIAEVIREILNKPEKELLEMGKRGRKLMEDKYEQHKVAEMMQKLYEWIYKGMKPNTKPEFVYL